MFCYLQDVNTLYHGEDQYARTRKSRFVLITKKSEYMILRCEIDCHLALALEFEESGKKRKEIRENQNENIKQKE